ncbi:MAG TPA: hypothetical protein VF335_05505, partial [Chitinivibrionales bacterium]
MNLARFFLWTLSFLVFIAPVFAIKSLEDVKVGGTYHMILTTGDELEGIVESKDDTSLILESKGSPYTFTCNLIVEYKLLAPPPASPKEASPAIPGAVEYSYDELQKKQPLGANLEVRISSGPTFPGTLVSIDDEYLKLNINGSVIPLAKTVINKIATPSTT